MAKIQHIATGAWRGQISDLAQKAIDDAAALGRELEARLIRIENDRTRNPLEKLPMRQKAAQDAKQRLDRTMALAYRFGVERAEEAQKARQRDLVPTSDNLSAMTLAAHLMNQSPAEIKKMVQVDPRFAQAANYYPPEAFGLKREEHAEMMNKAWERHYPEKAQIEQAAIDELKALDTLTRNVGGYCDIEIAQCEQGLQSAGRVED